MRFWPLALVCSAGCAQLFGLDETTSAPDASPSEVSLEVQRVSVGATVIKASQDMSGQTATFFADDGADGYTPTPGTLVPPHMFTAPLMTGTPPVLFTAPDMTTRFAAAARNQKVNLYAFERPGAPAAAATSKIMLSSTLPSPYVSTESFILTAIGPWTQHSLVAADLPAPDMGLTTISVLLDYTTQFTSLIGSTTRPRISAADNVVLARYVGARLTGYMETQFDQGDATDPVGGTMTALTPDHTLTATVDPTGYGSRFSGVKPAVTGLAMNWAVVAAPGADVGQSRGIQLIAGSSATTDTMLMAMYGNPFAARNWKAVLSYSTSSSRTFTSGTATFGLGASMSTLSDAAMTTAVTFPAGLPIRIRANLTELITDGMNVPLDLTKPVTIDADIEKPTATFYSLVITEFEINGMMVTRKLVVDALTAGAPSFKLPSSLFQVGHTYVATFRVHDGGFTNAAAGDFQTFSLPFSTAALDSALFTVVAP